MKIKVLVLALIATASLLLAPAPVQAEWLTNSLSVPSAFASMTNATLTDTSATAYWVYPGAALALDINIATATAAGTSNYLAGLDLTHDGVHWTTDAPIRVAGNLNGTTTVNLSTNISAANMANIRGIRIGYATTANLATNGITAAYVTQFR